MSEAISKEGFSLNADGTFVMWVDGEEYRQRRPTVGEFSERRDDLQEKLDQINDAVDDGNAVRGAIEAEAKERPERDAGGDPVLTPEERHRSRQAGKAVTALRERLAKEWWADTVNLLNRDDKRITADGIPPWLWDENQTIVLLAHWRTVPSLSGGR